MSTTLAAGTATSGAALSSDTSGILQLQSGSTPTTAVTVDTSQNVLIGTTTANGKLTIGSTAVGNNTIYESISNGSGAIIFGVENSSGGTLASGSSGYAAVLNQQNNYSLQFGTNNSVKMTLNNAGTLQLGVQTFPAYMSGSFFIPATSGASTTGGVNPSCFVNFTYPASGQPGFPQFVGNDYGPLWGIGQHNSSTTSTTDVRIGIVTTSGTSGLVWSGAYPALYSGSYTNASDYRIKENVVNYPEGALAQVNQLRPITYKLKDTTYQKGEESGVHVGKNEIGFLAHEVQAIIPLVVTGEKDAVDANGNEAHQGVDYGRMVTVLVKAIQELSAEVTALKAKVGA